MLFDHQIKKTEAADAYQLHRLVSSKFSVQEERNLFCDYGDHIRVRSSRHEFEGTGGIPVNPPENGSIVLIELRASCYVSSGGRKHFLKQGDWRSRHEWLEKKGVQAGFDVMTVTTFKSDENLKARVEFTLDCMTSRHV